MICELCGSKQAVYDSEIEGSLMKVCEDCSKFGKSSRSKKINIVIKEKRIEDNEPVFVFMNGYGAIVKRAREKLGLKQEEMAKRLNEKESLLHQIESEHIKPNVDLARKLERELRIKILEEIKDDKSNSKPNLTQSRSLTFGDFINRR
ncbi:TPA: TIGR00270 family protein [Candidatus Woesearchaeota archaeon]|nr:TIGR00270 family protein [Candidatus Woesearchaeota archaeon]HIH31611.1 TIGR00270 family protein [Candidatus Woesearchaeota archaeon]HIH55343.1 TIGR00270 family protein [Candidatus Woesearchaeota archaeon]HIJ01181.1 TIGR00270 family protein [Candidatus Woesearchaeota archaeon]HIJ14005.1 TIGR00270 family protein [Candidatus Woesearchaeota archaeon]